MQGVCVIIENEKNEFLLMLRDETPGIPFPNRWYFPSGVCDQGELPVKTVIREMKEELNLDVIRPLFFKEYYDADAYPNTIVEEYVFYLKTSKSIAEMELNEGAAIEFKNTEEILKLSLAFNHNQVFKDFLAYRGSKW